MTNYLDLSLNEIHELLKSHKIKPIDLVLESFRRIEENNLNDFITLNKEEASEYMWVTCDKLCYMLTYSPEIFASWFIICAPKIIEIIKNFNWQFLLYVITFLYP